MKAIIYAGIGLFSVATVYGVADYYSSQKKGKLDNLYKEQEETPMETEKSAVTTTTLPVNVSGEIVVNSKAVSKTNKKSKKIKRTIRLEEFSRGKIEESIIPEPEKKPETVKDAPKKNEASPVIEVKAAEPVQHVMVKKYLERKFSLDQFSRAPLRNPVRKSESVKIAKN